MGISSDPSKPSQNQPNAAKPVVHRITSTLGHLAIWPMFYALGAAIILGKFLEIPLSWPTLVYVGLCSHAGYLFDRIKFRNADMDPADRMAQPNRYEYLQKHAQWLRILISIEWVAALTIGFIIFPMLSLLVVGGIVVGFLYSGWKPGGRRARLKDIPGLKAGMVGAAVIGLGLAAVVASNHTSDASIVDTLLKLSWVNIAGLWLIVCGDAVICDMDDQASDRIYSTKSFPVLLGIQRSGILALGLLLAGSILLMTEHHPGQTQTRIAFTLAIIISGGGISLLQQRRDWIDSRMLGIVLLVISF